MNTSNKTLLQILVEELPKNGGWLRNVKTMTQDKNSDIWGYGCVSPYLKRDEIWSSKSGKDLVQDSKLEVRDLAVDWNTAIITREQYEAALAEKGVHTVKVEGQVVDADGWIAWAGGECPVACGVAVDIKFRDQIEPVLDGASANEFRWEHFENSGDIIAYRLHQPQDANSRANDERLEADLNDCIGQAQEDITLLTHFMLDEIRDSGINIRLDDAYELAQHLIDAGYRKQ